MTAQRTKQILSLIDFKSIIGAILIALVTWFGTITWNNDRALVGMHSTVETVNVMEMDLKKHLVVDIPEFKIMLTRIEEKQAQQERHINNIAKAINNISENQIYLSNLNVKSYIVDQTTDTNRTEQATTNASNKLE